MFLQKFVILSFAHFNSLLVDWRKTKQKSRDLYFGMSFPELKFTSPDVVNERIWFSSFFCAEIYRRERREDLSKESSDKSCDYVRDLNSSLVIQNGWWKRPEVQPFLSFHKQKSNKVK